MLVESNFTLLKGHSTDFAHEAQITGQEGHSSAPGNRFLIQENKGPVKDAVQLHYGNCRVHLFWGFDPC